MFNPLQLFRRKDADVDFSKATPQELLMLSRLSGVKERQFIENRLGVPIHKFGDYKSYLETSHKRVWATFRACKIIAAVIVSAQFKVIKEGEESDVDLLPGDEPTIRFSKGGFLTRPNPYDSWEELIEMAVFHLEVVGNAYLLKDEPDLYGRPTALYPLLPQYMKVVPGKTEKVAKYVYHVNGQEIEYDPEEIIHFKQTNPVDLRMGMGSVEPSESLYNQFINKATLEEKFVENGAQISGVLTREDADEAGIDEEQWKALKKKFNLEYAGKKNAGKIAFLNGKWSYHKLGMSMSEMQALEREKWTVEQIFMNHGVPLSVAGVQGAANYATARQDEINFRKYKVVPLLDTIVGKLNADGFIQATDPMHELVYELSGLIDVEQVVEDFLPLVNNGVVTRNELREMVGLPMLEDPMLDELTVTTNVIPLSLIGMSNPDDDLIDDVTLGNGKGRRRSIDYEPAKAVRRRKPRRNKRPIDVDG